MVKKIALHNLGCKVNSYEMEVMQQEIEKNGYKIVPFEQKADVYIVNTCSVTNIADRKSRQMLHKAKKENPEALIIAAGCYVQTKGEQQVLDDGVDLVIGNSRKSNLVDILNRYFADEDVSGLSVVADIDHEKEYEEMELSHTSEHTRAYIKVQDGCNQFCSYCVIPYARGRSRSRTIASVCEEISKLAAGGYREVVLTGIHLSSFADEDKGLIELIEAVNEIEDIQRIRLGSLEPRIITDDFAKRLSDCSKICAHFHLSLQSGCDNTLKRMNRHYSASEYLEGVNILRRYFKLPAITTDVIVGFPGETEEDFSICEEFLKKVNFYETHIFKYSKRMGTRAAVMDGQITEKEKSRRSSILLALNEKNKAAYISAYEGKRVSVLVEEEITIEEERYQVGYTKEYIRVAFSHEIDCTGRIVTGILHGSDLIESGQNICIISDIAIQS